MLLDVNIPEKTLTFMRHGRAEKNTEVGNGYHMSYDEFMTFLLKDIDPELKDPSEIRQIFSEEKNSKNILKFDVIYHSPSNRATKTAKIIQQLFLDKPKLECLESLEEVEFSKDIISLEEWGKGGLDFCRPLILERWFYGENKETFEDTTKRIKKLIDFLKEQDFRNALLITHAWLLRPIYMIFEQKDLESLWELKQAPLVKYGEFLTSYKLDEKTISDKHILENTNVI